MVGLDLIMRAEIPGWEERERERGGGGGGGVGWGGGGGRVKQCQRCKQMTPEMQETLYV